MLYGTGTYGGSAHSPINTPPNGSTVMIINKTVYGISFIGICYFFGYQIHAELFSKYNVLASVAGSVSPEEILVTGLNFILLPFTIGLIVISKHEVFNRFLKHLMLLFGVMKIKVAKRVEKKNNTDSHHVIYTGFTSSVYAVPKNASISINDTNYIDEDEGHYLYNYKNFQEHFTLIRHNSTFWAKSNSPTSFISQLLLSKNSENSNNESTNVLFSIYVLIVLYLGHINLIILGQASLQYILSLIFIALFVSIVPAQLTILVKQSSVFSLLLNLFLIVYLIAFNYLFFPKIVEYNFIPTNVELKIKGGEPKAIQLIIENNETAIFWDSVGKKSLTIPKSNIEQILYE